MTGYLLQQHPVLEKASFHPYPPIISLFHHTQVVSQQVFFYFFSTGPRGLVHGFVLVPLRLRSNWPHPDASVENSVQGPNILAVGARLHLVRLMTLCELTGMTVMVCKNECSYSDSPTHSHLLIAVPVLLRPLQTNHCGLCWVYGRPL